MKINEIKQLDTATKQDLLDYCEKAINFMEKQIETGNVFERCWRYYSYRDVPSYSSNGTPIIVWSKFTDFGYHVRALLRLVDSEIYYQRGYGDLHTRYEISGAGIENFNAKTAYETIKAVLFD